MPEGDRGLATAECREPARSDRLRSIAVSLQPAIPRFLGGLLPSKARFRFTGHRLS
jgi:hypothetical protein